MNDPMPFLRPSLVPTRTYLHHLENIDESHLYSNYGPLCTRFETQVLTEAYGGSGGFCTVNNATIGLMLAMRQARKAGKFALMPSFTFAATPLAAQWAGLEPYFIDVDPETWCMDPVRLDQALALLGDSVALVVPYATFGTGLDLSPYAHLHAAGIPVVVDAAASFGTLVDGQWFGSDFPGMVVFSFHATKAFGIGEGGAVYSANPELIQRLRRSGNFGFNHTRASCDQGLNSKISEYTAAIALATWDCYPDKVRRRRQVHENYQSRLGFMGLLDSGWSMQKTSGQVPFQFMPLLCPEAVPNEQIVHEMAGAGIECRTYFSPACHQQPQFSCFPRGCLSTTEDLSRRVLSLPLWENMTTKDVERVIRGLHT